MSVLRIPPALAEQALGALPDAELLARYLDGGDDTAFEVLVRRYGPAVRAACRLYRLNEADADDVFQNTFLELVRKAERIRVRAALGGWLYRVAERGACRLARNRRAGPLTDDLPCEHRSAFDDADVVLDEVAKLPEKYRQVVAFCYLGGKTTADAARELGWAKGTVLTRLAWARKRLHDRLTRRGVALSFAAVSAASARAVAATVSAARRALDAPPAVGWFPFLNTWKEAMIVPKVVTVAGVLVATAVGLWPGGHAGADTPSPPRAEVPKAKPAEAKWVGAWVKDFDFPTDGEEKAPLVPGRSLLTVRDASLTLRLEYREDGKDVALTAEADFKRFQGSTALGVLTEIALPQGGEAVEGRRVLSRSAVPCRVDRRRRHPDG